MILMVMLKKLSLALPVDFHIKFKIYKPIKKVKKNKKKRNEKYKFF